MTQSRGNVARKMHPQQAGHRRRSTGVQLVALGTVVLGGCSPDLPGDRYVYANHQECTAEWGEANCQHSNVTHSSGHYCLGPRYGSNVTLPSGETVRAGSANSPVVRSASGRSLGGLSQPVARGGFGGFARSMVSGG